MVERNSEVHTTHFIDSGEAIANGAKISDDREITIVVYYDSKIVGIEERRLNGMIVFTPSRARQLQVFEKAVALMADNPTLTVGEAVKAAAKTE
jgi:hypothetical protein